MKEILKKLLLIQSELEVPKEHNNNFGNYKYRNCEDILSALKPLLLKYKCIINISDDIINIQNRFYVKSTANIYDAESLEYISTSAFAREDESKPKMDGSQATGSASSYARKYALNGLLAIDDTKDSDFTNTDSFGKNKDKEVPKVPDKPKVEVPKVEIELASEDLKKKIFAELKEISTQPEITREKIKTGLKIESFSKMTKIQGEEFLKYINKIRLNQNKEGQNV
jgi:hypothetical protein